MHNKVLITGNAGAGKTTLSYQIASLLNINEVIHLDQFVWSKNWQPVNKETKEKSFAKIIEKNSWIIDGVLETILNDADTIIFLDFPRYVCYFRALKRTIKYAFRSRPELPEQASDIFVIGKLIKIIWNFPLIVQPKILNLIAEAPKGKVIFHIQNKNDLLNMLRALSFL